jgi:hypothetical protein
MNAVRSEDPRQGGLPEWLIKFCEEKAQAKPVHSFFEGISERVEY